MFWCGYFWVPKILSHYIKGCQFLIFLWKTFTTFRIRGKVILTTVTKNLSSKKKNCLNLHWVISKDSYTHACIHAILKLIWWLPWWVSGKESACQCRRHGFDLWVRNIPRGRKWQLTPVFLSGEFHAQRSLEGYSPWSQKSWTWLSN